MSEKFLNSRIIHKHDTETNWEKSSLVPKQAEIIIYDKDDTHTYERIKIGDGVTNVSDLPFYAGSWDDLADKPFYEAEHKVELLAESSYTTTSDITRACEFNSGIVNGKTYVVTHNGTVYELVATNNTIGDRRPFILDDISGGFDYPFCIWNNSVYLYGAGDHTIKVECIDNEVKKIDSKFLPDGLSKEFIVSINYSDKTCDKTYKEILDAYNNGYAIKAIIADSLNMMTTNLVYKTYDEFNFIFSRGDFQSTIELVEYNEITIGVATISSDNVVKIMQFSVNDSGALVKRVNGVFPDELGNVTLTIPDATTIDSTLSISGAAADAKVVGDAISNLNTLVGDTSVSSQISTAIENKIDKVDGKGLSTNDYTTDEKNKLAGIEAGANKTVVDSALSATSTNPVQNKVINTAISNLNTLVGDISVSNQITDAIDGLNLSSTYIAATQKGAANGLAELDSSGKVPSAQLPSYVDDVLEYSAKSSFPSTGEAGKIYVDTSTNLTYRWSGSAYVEISPSLAIGTTSSTAFRGDYGNIAYTHATAKGSAFSSGLYKITTNDQGHVTAATAVAKSDITRLGIPAQDTTYSAATTSEAGLMSASDKSKLDEITPSADSVSFSAGATSGNKVGTITINGTATDMYSPIQTSVSGNAGTATKLATARTIQTNLGSTSGASFDGSANVTPGVSGVLPIGNGGTGANNSSDALANLGAFRFLGNNVISSTDDDTTSNWGTLGSGYAFFSNNGLLNDQPSQWGIVVNFVTGNDIFQMWHVQTGGPTYWRGGNASGWNGTWAKVYDTANKPTPSDIGAATESHTHNLQDLSGTLPVSNGGTGATTRENAAYNVLANTTSYSDCDSCTNIGTYATGPTWSNSPLVTYGTLFVYRPSDNWIVQIWTSTDTGSGKMFMRKSTNGGAFGAWHQLLTSAETSPTLSSTDESAVERTQYFYIGNTLVMSGITPEVECANNAVTSYSVWFPKTFTSGCTVMASLYYNNDESSSAAFVNAVAGWYQNNTMVIKFSNTSGGARNLRASWLAIGM